MFKAQTFGMTDYLRSSNPPSYFHDGWDFGYSEVGRSTVYAIHAGTVKKSRLRQRFRMFYLVCQS
ncbi:hypothetical protein [Lactobacillus helveticus]|uniref:hypothetical protein n=1 Tax=Lactobacillus helveticus TaxID=1587 RepID=UPI001A0DF0AB|nr:hypothetical protein [Lactobacillus helveticus]GFP09640.1 hypothetical protein LHEJCM1006_17860 [Lactobacillus helveticus]